jgi:hypothetical protein
MTYFAAKCHLAVVAYEDLTRGRAIQSKLQTGRIITESYYFYSDN